MTTELAPRTKRSYTPAQVEEALQTVAALGTTTAASEQLGIPDSTISDWVRDTHADRYLAIRTELAPKLHQAIAAKTEDLILDMADVRRKALKHLEQGINDLAPKDAAATVKNLAIAESTGTEKVLLLRGKPTTITEHRPPDELVRKLKTSGLFTDTTAEELPQPVANLENPTL